MNADRIAAARDAGWAYFKARPDELLVEAWWEAQRQGWVNGPERAAFVEGVMQGRRQRDEKRSET